jgi:hypothetical protein
VEHVARAGDVRALALYGGGARGAPGTIWWVAAVGVALFFWLSLTGGVFYFPGGRTVARRSAPRRYWALMGGLALLVVVALALGIRAYMVDLGMLQ